MIKVLRQPAYYSTSTSSSTISKFRGQFGKPLGSAPSSTSLLCDSKLKLSSIASFKCFSTKDDNSHQASSQSFSVLPAETPWDSGSLWNNMAFYMFTLHIPLSFGWLSAVVEIFQQPILDPQTEAISLLLAQTSELIVTLVLLKCTAKPNYDLMNFFKVKELSKERNWFLASAIGFGFLFALVGLTSFLADRVLEPKAVNNPILKEIFVSGNISKAACVLVYCIVTPMLEETVYRGFLLRSLSSTMKWQHAVLISSAIFSAAHLSVENFIQLFIIGCVLGCSYCWTGNLCSSFLIHSIYNAMTLVITFLS